MTELTGIKAHRPHNTDVGDFINNKLREIDNDPVQPPYDSLQEYAYEGEGSICGSTLSSLDYKFDDNKGTAAKKPSSSAKKNSADNDLESMQNWGPKFNKISDLYGLKAEAEES